MSVEQFELSEAEPLPTPSNAWFVLTITFLFIDYVRPQDTIKLLDYLRIGMITMVVLIFFLLTNSRLINWKIPQLRLIRLFVILLTLEIPFAVNHHYAFNAAVTLFMMLPFILSFICCIDSFRRLKAMLLSAVLFMAYQAQFAIRHHGCGTGSQFLDENDFSLYINTWLPICFALLLSQKILWQKFLFGAIAVLGIAANVIGKSRGGFTGLIVMLFIFWLFNPKKMVSLLIISLVGISLYFFAGEKYWSRIATASDTQHGTAKERIESWKAGWQMFLHNPLGVGGNNFQVRFTDYQSDYFHRGMWGRVAHSLWFTLLSETGIVGTFIYLFLLFINFRDIFRLRNASQFFQGENSAFIKHLSVALLASLAGFFVSASFISVLYYPHYWYICGIIAISTILVNKSILPFSDENPLNVA